RGHGHAVLVVLAHEHHRQVPHGGQGQGLVPGALAHGPVAVEAHGDLPVAGELVGQPGAGGDGHAAGDDAVGAEVAGGDVGDVHRPAAAAAVAGVLGQQLGHHSPQV